MTGKTATPERSMERGLLYVGIVVATYLLSHLNLLFLPAADASHTAVWKVSSAMIYVAVGFSIRIGMILAAIVMLAFWVCCSAGSGPIRIFTGAGLTLTGVWWPGIFTVPGLILDWSFALFVSGMMVFHFMIVVAFAWAERQLGGWPAPARESEVAESSIWRFNLAELFLLTTSSCAALATLAALTELTNYNARILIGIPPVEVIAGFLMCHAPFLDLGGLRDVCGGRSDRSLTRTLWFLSGLLVIAFFWIGIEWSFFRDELHHFPSWICVLPGILTYYFGITLSLLAAREFGWLEVPIQLAREKPVPIRLPIAQDDGES